MWDKKGYGKANHKCVKGPDLLLTYGRTGLVTSPQLVPIYCSYRSESIGSMGTSDCKPSLLVDIYVWRKW